MTRKLRTGRTTGSCAAAAAMAGTIFLLTGKQPASIDVPLPPGGRLSVPIDRYEQQGEKDSLRVSVIKDGGDDPDATHGCDIQAIISIDHDSPGPLTVFIDGGIGVGRATLPGLPVKVGTAAINPEPLRQIETSVREAAESMESGRITVLIEVPEGETIAKRTLNPRLGIKGGISILGTHGIVKPYSHDSWKATVEEALDVARAQGLDHAIFTTGRSSERLYQETHPKTPVLALVQAADFFEFSMQAATKRKFSRVTWSLFFGKLVKQAQGLAYTHARTHPVDFSRLADWCKEAGVADEYQDAIRGANTARQVLMMLEGDAARPRLVELLVSEAKRNAERFCEGRCEVGYVVFDFDGTRLT
ncbi:MAG: cobalt-precorrin-5B (C(1))-methyltransferase [Pseudodesulfovibrio sp.]|nr:cobalt-precorrin-5B (C(1))-methyltransferase [Pseudodesulfovibrio sp.]